MESSTKNVDIDVRLLEVDLNSILKVGELILCRIPYLHIFCYFHHLAM